MWIVLSSIKMKCVPIAPHNRRTGTSTFWRNFGNFTSVKNLELGLLVHHNSSENEHTMCTIKVSYHDVRVWDLYPLYIRGIKGHVLIWFRINWRWESLVTLKQLFICKENVSPLMEFSVLVPYTRLYGAADEQLLMTYNFQNRGWVDYFYEGIWPTYYLY